VAGHAGGGAELLCVGLNSGAVGKGGGAHHALEGSCVPDVATGGLVAIVTDAAELRRVLDAAGVLGQALGLVALVNGACASRSFTRGAADGGVARADVGVGDVVVGLLASLTTGSAGVVLTSGGQNITVVDLAVGDGGGAEDGSASGRITDPNSGLALPIEAC